MDIDKADVNWSKNNSKFPTEPYFININQEEDAIVQFVVTCDHQGLPLCIEDLQMAKTNW